MEPTKQVNLSKILFIGLSILGSLYSFTLLCHFCNFDIIYCRSHNDFFLRITENKTWMPYLFKRNMRMEKTMLTALLWLINFFITSQNNLYLSAFIKQFCKFFFNYYRYNMDTLTIYINMWLVWNKEHSLQLLKCYRSQLDYRLFDYWNDYDIFLPADFKMFLAKLFSLTPLKYYCYVKQDVLFHY